MANIENLSTLIKPSVSLTETGKGVFQLSNDQYKLEIINDSITSLIDLTANHQVLARGGKANQMVIFEDKPLYRQTWDVKVFHLTSRKELASGTIEIAE